MAQDKHGVKKAKASKKPGSSDPATGKVGKQSLQGKPKGVFTLLAEDAVVDPALSSLFTPAALPNTSTSNVRIAKLATAASQTPPIPVVRHQASQPAKFDSAEAGGEVSGDADDFRDANAVTVGSTADSASDRRRKRKRESQDEDDLEAAYLHRLTRLDETAKSRGNLPGTAVKVEARDVQRSDETPDNRDAVLDDNGATITPNLQHETAQATDTELEKAARTVFLGNVATTAITSKSARKLLVSHLTSILPSLAAKHSGDGKDKPKLESIRFRSTPYASALPKKAAFARKDVMDATASSTNAYAVYSSTLAAKEAVKQLNGTVILHRHLRVDSVAHPSKVDNRRCVFVGNLGFVDDESHINAANAEEGREKRKGPKQPADVEEGLWRTFGKCGTVESVRVVRDSTTRVGKGIAYVQFASEESVEQALLMNEKKDPPLLPRKLRVMRCKGMKKKKQKAASAAFKHISARESGGRTGFHPKIAPEEASKRGRAGRLFGKAAAARTTKQDGGAAVNVNGVDFGRSAMVKPEAFVFEGYRATTNAKKAGLKLGRRTAKKGRPTARSAKFRTAQRKQAK